MHNNIPDNNLYIYADINIYRINVRLKNNVIVDIPMHIIVHPVEFEKRPIIAYPMAHCIQDIHDIIRQRYPDAEYNFTLGFEYSPENLFTSEGWIISATSATPSIVTQYFIRQPRNTGRYQLRCITTSPKITPTTTFLTNIEENTALLDAHYHFIHAHPNVIWYESNMNLTVPFPQLSNAELDVVFSHNDQNILIHAVKLHTYDYTIPIEANMSQQAIDTLINKIPVNNNISQHEYITFIRWLRQLPLTYDTQISPIVAKATNLFHAYHVLTPSPN